MRKKNNFSIQNKLKKDQRLYEFVDIDLNNDNLLFIDPRLIGSFKGKYNISMNDRLKSFTLRLIKELRLKNKTQVDELINCIEEPLETKLGYCNNSFSGNSIGDKLKFDFIKEIENNPVITGGPNPRLSDFELFVENINSDRVSDLTTKIIMKDLIYFTKDQCNKFNVPVNNFIVNCVFDDTSCTWIKNFKCTLPYYNGDPIILVPKYIVRKKGGANSALRYFINYAIKEFILKDENETRYIKINKKLGRFTKKDWEEYYFKKYNHKPNKKSVQVWIEKYKPLLDSFSNDYVMNKKFKPLSDEEISEIIY